MPSRGDRSCIQNTGGEPSWKVATQGEQVGNGRIILKRDHREIGCEDVNWIELTLNTSDLFLSLASLNV
jgi:hypothetical protein